MKKKIFLAVFVLLISAYTVHYNCSIPTYEYSPVSLPGSFNEFYSQKLSASKALGARPGNEERLVRYSPGKTPIAILYIHGYGASRAEGEYVIDMIAKELRANTYYLRLPGHGTSKDDMKKQTYKDYINEAITTLSMMDKLGDKIIVAGTSMGGIITTYLAAAYPEKISGAVLVSPFYNFPSPLARMMNHYPFFKLYVTLNPIRVSSSPVPPDEDNWTGYWYRDNYFSSVRQLINLRRLIARESVYEKVSTPTLMLYYYKDEANKDETASVEHMKIAFEQFGRSSKSHPLNKAVAIGKGDHVLMSRFYEADKDLMVKETVAFARSAAGAAK